MKGSELKELFKSIHEVFPVPSEGGGTFSHLVTFKNDELLLVIVYTHEGKLMTRPIKLKDDKDLTKEHFQIIKEHCDKSPVESFNTQENKDAG